MNDPSNLLDAAYQFQRQGRAEEAQTLARQVLDGDPRHADALHLMGLGEYGLGNHQAAVDYLSKAATSAPASSNIQADMAAAYLALGQAENAARCAKQAAALDPGSGIAYYNLGNALFALGDAAAAADAYAGALKTDPDNQIFWTNHLFALNFSPDADAQDIFERNRAWGRRLEETISAVAIGLSDPDPERKLHLAYYLPELNTHVTPRFLEPVLGAHDTALFRISLYGSRTDGAPPPPSLIQDHRWVDIAGQSDAAIAGRMQSDQVDILLHPCTFKARYRSLLAHRAAPVQIAGINLVSTTGLSAADYLMTDAALDPPGKSERYYSEKLIRLPAFNTYRTPAAAPDIGPLPASLNAGVTFGSLNNPVKLSDRAIAAWAEILNKLDGARLILKHRSLANEDVVGRYQSRFQAAGAGQDHLIFEGFTSDAGAYLDSYNRIDIALDPFPFGGGTTSYEAIWMGVPIITMEGRTLMGRLTASFMHRLGLSEWVAADPESYVKCAIRLAGDLDALAALRAQMRDRARTTIFDAEAFTRSLEDACRGVWRQTVSEL